MATVRTLTSLAQLAGSIAISQVTNLSASLALLAPLASAALTGTPTAPSPPDSDASTRIATTQYVNDRFTTLVGTAPANLDTLQLIAAQLGNDESVTSGIVTTLGTKAPINNASFTGTTTANSFVGPLTGNVTGNVSGNAASITGNVSQSQVTNLTSTLATLAPINNASFTGSHTVAQLSVGTTGSGFDVNGNLKAVAATLTGALNLPSGVISKIGTDNLVASSSSVTYLYAGTSGLKFNDQANTKTILGLTNSGVVTTLNNTLDNGTGAAVFTGQTNFGGSAGDAYFDANGDLRVSPGKTFGVYNSTMSRLFHIGADYLYFDYLPQFPGGNVNFNGLVGAAGFQNQGVVPTTIFNQSSLPTVIGASSATASGLVNEFALLNYLRPIAAPATGSGLYVDSADNKLKYRGSSGTITVLASA